MIYCSYLLNVRVLVVGTSPVSAHTTRAKWSKRTEDDHLTTRVAFRHIVVGTFFAPTLGSCNIVPNPKSSDNYNYMNRNKHSSNWITWKLITCRSTCEGPDQLDLYGKEIAGTGVGYASTPHSRSHGPAPRKCTTMRS